MAKNIILCSVLISLLGCTDEPWQTGENHGRLVLPDIQIVPGGHCESSAIVNALNYLDYPYNEDTVVGGGGAIGFMFQRGEFPFLGGRSFDLREVFFDAANISWHKKSNETAAESWQGVIEVLERGIPVILRVDMRYLPYLYGGKYGSAYMSFGWHMITLFGIDFESETAMVSDTAAGELQIIKLKDLEKARSSNTEVFPPFREYYWVEKKPEAYEPDWDVILKNSIDKVIENYEWRPGSPEEAALGLGGLEGLEQLGNEILNFESIVKKTYLLSSTFSFLHGCIETNGTGGAAFRIFYRNFLLQMADKTDNPKLREAAALLEKSIEAWHNLSGEFLRMSGLIKKLKTKDERGALYVKAAVTAATLHDAEKAFYLYIRDEL